jgi:midasin (ATPase involved in ribosome maturation)
LKKGDPRLKMETPRIKTKTPAQTPRTKNSFSDNREVFEAEGGEGRGTNEDSFEETKSKTQDQNSGSASQNQEFFFWQQKSFRSWRRRRPICCLK